MLICRERMGRKRRTDAASVTLHLPVVFGQSSSSANSLFTFLLPHRTSTTALTRIRTGTRCSMMVRVGSQSTTTVSMRPAFGFTPSAVPTSLTCPIEISRRLFSLNGSDCSHQNHIQSLSMRFLFTANGRITALLSRNGPALNHGD